MLNTLWGSIAVLALLFGTVSGARADGPNFAADGKFNRTNLTGWKTLGAADWKVQGGEIIGAPRQISGGWLFLDKSFEDVAVYARFRCASGCKTGILLRAEKTPTGMKGIFVSLADGDQISYAITLDAEGKELSRERLAPSTGDDVYGGLANVMGNISAEHFAAIRLPANRPLPIPAGISLPGLQPPTTVYHPGEQNEINIILYQNLLDPTIGRAGLQRTGLEKAVTPASRGSYGPIAIYVGGTNEVRIEDVRYKDLNIIKSKPDKLSPDFTMLHINRYYLSWGTAIADLNHDGVPDVIAGPYYYLGPDFTEAHEIYTPKPYNPGSDYPQHSMLTFSEDFTGDGWPDILYVAGSAGVSTGTLYVNPQGKNAHWASYQVLDHVGNEDARVVDLFGDGMHEIVHSIGNQLAYSKPDPKDPTGKWITTIISEPGPWGANIVHGTGVGDINGDGRLDVLTVYGWWEQPPRGTRGLWTYHPQEFGRWGHSQGGAGGAELGVYDVNGDGLNDVVTSLEGHGVGIGWFEQKRDPAGKITFVPHMIMDSFLTKNAGDVTFTQAHATAFADMDGDGIPDLITGKRVMAHLYGYTDPDPFGTPVFYVYRTVRNPKAPGGAEFIPTLIDNFTGMSGSAIADLNGDKTPDIVTSGIYGTFVFYNHMKQHPPLRPAKH